MTQAKSAMLSGGMLTVGEAAERLGTSPRFVRRLIAERRIAFHKIGRHVRIAGSDIQEYIHAGRVEPSDVRTGGYARR